MWFFYALLAAMIWGLNYALWGVVLEKISVFSLLAFSFFLSALFFVIIANFNQLKVDLYYLIAHKKIAYLVILQVLCFIFASLFISLSIKTSNNPPLAALIESIYPIFSLIFLYVFFDKNLLDLRFLLGTILILSGLFVIQLS